MAGQIEQQAALYMSGREDVTWGTDPAQLAAWTMTATFIENSLQILDGVIAALKGSRIVHNIDPGQ
jgi:hypothetical protein